MTTALEIVTGALQELGVLDADEAATAEDAARGLKKLNDMIAAWENDDLVLGVPALVLVDTISLPASHIEALETNLAIRLGPSFGEQPSPITVQLAASGFDALVAAYRVPRSVPVDAGLLSTPSQRYNSRSYDIGTDT